MIVLGHGLHGLPGKALPALRLFSRDWRAELARWPLWAASLGQRAERGPGIILLPALLARRAAYTCVPTYTCLPPLDWWLLQGREARIGAGERTRAMRSGS